MENVVIAKLIKNGTSLVVVIPKNILNALNLRRGDQVLMQVPNTESIVISRLSDKELLQLKKDAIPEIHL